jgi:sensor histidine kinase YesM
VHAATCAAIVALNQILCHLFPLAQPAPFDQHNPPPSFRIGPDILIYLVTMSANVAFAHFRQAQERERRAIELEARLAQARLQALRMQINPHFLFNTLNAISTLVHTNPAVADDMITDLGELFRGSMESSDEQEVPLARELELLGRYLAIEQRRFGQRLEVTQNVAPEILSALVPTLILQPLVENAIRHGIEPQKKIGKVAVQCRRDGGKIVLSVSDNGTKPVDFSLLTNNSPRRGIGLANTRARLQQLYGKQSSLSLGQAEPIGWIVEIALPFHSEPVKIA